MALRLAADVGGTFTDAVCLDEETGDCAVVKTPTVSDDIAVGVISGFDQLTGGDYRRVACVVHGTTAGLNALLQRAGAKTALVTTKGFRDVYEIGRGNHPDMYNKRYRKPQPLLARSDVFEIDERIASNGAELKPVDPGEVSELALRLAGVYESVAVALIHSYANRDHETLVEAILRQTFDLPISLSSEVAPELGEYERTATTVMNAYVAPPIRLYVERLRRLLSERGYDGPAFVMRSNGGMATERVAARGPVRVLMSGPVGGVIGARAVGAWLGAPDLLAVDMGGTSFDVSLLVDGEVELTMETQLAGFPVLAPSVRTVSVGAGGGSVAWTQTGGMRVGPRSAGARPGPACYGKGGSEPTTTDANLVLGRISPERFADGRLPLKPALARLALSRYGEAHGLDPVEAAAGVVTITNATMSDAIRQISIRRGLDPRELTLFAYGGCGPLHAAELADELAIRRVIVPAAPGAFSAWGMLHAELSQDGVAPVLCPLPELTQDRLGRACAQIQASWDLELSSLIAAGPAVSKRMSLDCRYQGQKYTVNLAIDHLPLERVRQAFDNRYRLLYGFSSPDTEVEVVNVRLAQAAPAADYRPPAQPPPTDGHRREGAGSAVDRSLLRPGDTVAGPAVIADPTATAFIPSAWTATVAGDGSLLLNRDPDQEVNNA
ncbi:MAG: hydantoinase/oxoprolinase family protein [Bifidobacteriaceae bacterium]|nr:hydantoinase/oxoprolinase family protein [Bifidobacteriaceae bacterium]